MLPFAFTLIDAVLSVPLPLRLGPLPFASNRRSLCLGGFA
jgi:hypothetical protein